MSFTREHIWHYDYFDSKSRWIFVTPSEFAQSLGIYVTELGHFLQDGNCYTKRRPENTFSINFSPANGNEPGAPIKIVFQDKSYVFDTDIGEQGVVLVDNRPGYVIEQTGKHESYFIQCGGFLAEKYSSMILGREKLFMTSINYLSTLIDYFENLVQLYRQPTNEKRDAYASMLLIKIFSRLFVEKDSAPILYVENKYVKGALEIIEQRFSESIRLSTVADELHINSSYLSRLFLSETGTSFSACLSHIRINHAKEMLRTTEFSVEEIAIRCGFCNSSHFIKFFHAAEGMTPMQYRTVWHQK
ncbi:MAG: helix-turn-helix transcriptional regulator [Clostridia bacterium]|nr:helix-turn-helix transcriptional regulator [Clostridia bacterium]